MIDRGMFGDVTDSWSVAFSRLPVTKVRRQVRRGGSVPPEDAAARCIPWQDITPGAGTAPRTIRPKPATYAPRFSNSFALVRRPTAARSRGMSAAGRCSMLPERERPHARHRP